YNKFRNNTHTNVTSNRHGIKYSTRLVDAQLLSPSPVPQLPKKFPVYNKEFFNWKISDAYKTSNLRRQAIRRERYIRQNNNNRIRAATRKQLHVNSIPKYFCDSDHPSFIKHCHHIRRLRCLNN